MNVRCVDTEQLVQRYLDRELSANEQRELFLHLESCSECSARFEPMLDLVRRVEEAPCPEPPAELYDRVVSNLPPIEGRSRRGVLWTFGALAAAASLVLILRGPVLDHLRPGWTPSDDGAVAASQMPDPVVVMSTVSAFCTTRVGPAGVLAALAASNVVTAAAQQNDSGPIEVALCMTFANGDEPSAFQVPGGVNVLQLIPASRVRGGGI